MRKWKHHTYRSRTQFAACGAIADRVVTRWTQCNRVARRTDNGPSRRSTSQEVLRIFQQALTNRRMTAAEFLTKVTGRVSSRRVRNRLLEAGLRFRVATRCLPLTPVWCSAMSLASVCGSQIDANVSIDDLVKGHRERRLSRRIPLQFLESWYGVILNVTTGRIC